MTKAYFVGGRYGSTDNNSTSSSITAAEEEEVATSCSSSCFSSQDSGHDATTLSPSHWRNTNIPVLVTAFLAALASGGPTYAFGLYAQQLKTSLHLTQSQITTISAANFCAGLLSWIPGMCVDAWGSRLAMIVGGLVEAVALMAYYVACTEFAIRDTEPNVTVPSLSLIGVLIFMSNSLVIGALFKMMVQSCKTTKGSAVGAAKGYLGLGAGVYAVLFDCLKVENNLLFLPMAAILCLLAIVLPAVVLLPNKQVLNRHALVEAAGPKQFRIVYMGLVVLATLVLLTSCKSLLEEASSSTEEVFQEASATEVVVDIDRGRSRMVQAMWVLTAWFVPILALFYVSNPTSDDQTAKVPQTPTKAPSSEIQQLLLGSPDSSSGHTLELEKEEDDDDFESQWSKLNAKLDEYQQTAKQQSPPSYDNDKTLLQMLQTTTAWLFCWTCTIRVGSGTILTNNMGQMVESLGFAPRTASASLAFFSVAQAMARVGVGTISDAAMDWKACSSDGSGGLPRPAFLAVSTTLGIVGHAILAYATSLTGFVSGVVVSGIAFGMIWPLMVLIVGEVFGTTNHGANYMFYDGFTSAVGTLAISKFLASYVYERHIVHNDDEETLELACYGRACFGLSHQVIVVLSLTCLATSIIVWIQTKKLYKKQIITTPKMQRIRSNDELYGSPYKTWRKRDALRY